MKITGIKLHVLDQETSGYVTSFSGLFKEDQSYPFKYSLVRVLTDVGIEGHYIVWSEIPTAQPHALAEVLRAFKPHLINEDPLNRERIWQRLGSLWYGQKGPAFAAIDIALWDIAGKAANLPLYKLLGTYRDEVRAYASGNVPTNIEDIVRIATKLKHKGFTAMKLHPIPIAACGPLREAVGEEVDLIYDAVFSHRYDEAVKIGQVLERLNFYWYEAPLPAHDIRGYIKLARSLEIPLTVELIHSSDYVRFIQREAVDILRTMCGFTGGITEMRKAAHLCESFGINWEPHTYGGTYYQVAHLHVILAVHNCSFFELPIENSEEGCFDVGTKDVIRIDTSGNVRPTLKPGLGIDLDWNPVEKGMEITV